MPAAFIIFKAMDACRNSGNDISDHFGEVTEMVPIGSGAQRGFKQLNNLVVPCLKICQHQQRA